MKAVAMVLAVLLAGCSGGQVQDTGAEAPVAGPAPTASPADRRDPFELSDSGTMLHGIDEAWAFTLHPNATSLQVRITALPIQGNMELAMLEAKALLDGAVHADGSVTGSQGSFGSASARHLIDIVERPRDGGNLTAFTGEWELVLRGGNQLADYAVHVEVLY